MKLSDINPHIRYARIHHTLLKANEYSVCYDCRLFFVKQGGGNIAVKNEEYKFSNNTVIYLPPGTRYRISGNEGEDIDIIIFNFDLVNDFSYLEKSLSTAKDSTFDERRVIRYEMPEEFSQTIIRTAPQLYELLKQGTEEFLTAAPYYRETASAQLKMCLMYLLREVSDRSDAQVMVISSVLDFIHQNYHLCELSNEDIARRFGYHPYYLSRLFKNSVGKTVRRYLTDYRIRMAKNYLITTELDIAVVAWKSGFSSAAYFTKTFRGFVGATPKEYRKSRINSII